GGGARPTPGAGRPPPRAGSSPPPPLPRRYAGGGKGYASRDRKPTNAQNTPSSVLSRRRARRRDGGVPQQRVSRAIGKNAVPAVGGIFPRPRARRLGRDLHSRHGRRETRHGGVRARAGPARVPRGTVAIPQSPRL